MNYMIMLPGGNMGIVVDTHIYGVAEAMEKFPGITNDLIAAGEFHETGTVVDNRYYTEEPTFEFRVNLHTDYPEQYLVDDVTQCGDKFGCKFDKRSFNWCYFKTYNYGCAVAFKDWSEVSRPGWTFVIEEKVEPETDDTQKVIEEADDVPVMLEGANGTETVLKEELARPTLEEAVLVEKEIEEAVITPDLDFADIPHPKPEVDVMDDSEQEITVKDGTVPDECKGEIWAQTWKHCRPEQVVNDAYCIEHNWEKRGDYYIIDCVMTGNRLIHSDKVGVNFATSAKECR